jgi:uncharacterized protein with ParB-like and HNH nuclease domain
LEVLYEDDSESHFLGSFVTQDIQSTLGSVSSYIVIDGQQRITTISILLAALRDFADTNEYKEKFDDAKGTVAQIHDLLTNRYSEKDSHIKVLPTQIDREAYSNIILRKEIINCRGSIYDSYRFFYAEIKRFFKEKDVNIKTFQRNMQKKIELVHISLGKSDNPSLIYESLNYKGQPLSQADLIRNYFFMELPEEIHDQVYEDYWLSLERRFKKPENAGDNYLVEMTNAFWYYLRKDGKAVNYKATYSTLKEKVEESKPRDKSLVHEFILGEFKEMCKFSEYYLYINFPQEEPNPKLRQWFKSWSQLNYSSVYPFVLNIYDDCMQKKIELKEMERILNILESFLIRRWFVDIASGGLNKTFIALYPKLQKQGDIVDSNLLRKVLREGERIKSWPSDAAFKKAIVERPIYAETKDNRRRIKFVFQKIQEKISKEIVDFSNLNIEHVLPQTLTDTWKEVLGDNPQEKQKQWGDTLGNLTMVTDGSNSSMSNKEFTEKLEYLKCSNLAINSYFKDKNSWNISDIQERAEYLANLALKIWPR